MNKTCRVLVVEDNTLLCSVLKRSLDSMQVTFTQSGAAALEVVRRQQFDVLVLDVRLPDMNGVQLAQELIQIQPAYAEQLLFLTGGMLNPRDHAVLEAESWPLLHKPFSMKELCHLIYMLEPETPLSTCA